MALTEQLPPGGESGPGPGGGTPPRSDISTTTSSLHHQQPLTYAKALGGANGGAPNVRKYAEIIAQQKAERNFLELRIKKVSQINRDTGVVLYKPKNLSFDDIIEFIFEILSIQFEDCIGVDLNAGRYDTR